MKAIFLDIDGVLNFRAFPDVIGGIMGVSDDRILKLCEIVKSTGAAIVLTSSWKKYWDDQKPNSRDLNPHAKYLFDKLAKFNLHFADRTDERDPSLRGHGIKAWLRRVSSVDSWVVLDDDVFQDYEECGVMPRLVKTNFEEGLTDDHVAMAIKILNGE